MFLFFYLHEISHVDVGQKNPKLLATFVCMCYIFYNQPVVDAPVEAEVEGAEVATLPDHLHHSLVVQLWDVPQVQDTQVTQLREETTQTSQLFMLLSFMQTLVQHPQTINHQGSLLVQTSDRVSVFNV